MGADRKIGYVFSPIYGQVHRENDEQASHLGIPTGRDPILRGILGDKHYIIMGYPQRV